MGVGFVPRRRGENKGSGELGLKLRLLVQGTLVVYRLVRVSRDHLMEAMIKKNCIQ